MQNIAKTITNTASEAIETVTIPSIFSMNVFSSGTVGLVASTLVILKPYGTGCIIENKTV